MNFNLKLRLTVPLKNIMFFDSTFGKLMNWDKLGLIEQEEPNDILRPFSTEKMVFYYYSKLAFHFLLIIHLQYLKFKSLR